MVKGLKTARGVFCILLAAGVMSCGGSPRIERDLARPADHATFGVASWYGPGFHGKRTASGERFNRNDLTAAHRSLPFGTVIRVKNLHNGRSVDVRINDRGPFVKGRIIDLSEEAASRIDLRHRGIGEVELQVLSLPGR
jgi:rare lipoprotein A